jgi:hypothetical protein
VRTSKGQISWGAELQGKLREILDGLDKFVATSILNSLNMSNLEFRSPNTTSQVQPVDMGVTENLKTYVAHSWYTASLN